MTSATPLRFVHVSTFFPPQGFGGDAVQVHRLASGLADRGHSVRVVHAPAAFDIGEGATLQGFETPAGVDVVPLDVGRAGLLSSYLLGRPSGFGRELRALLDGADIVHFHNPSLIGGPGALTLDDRPLSVYSTHEHWLLCPTHVLFRYGREPCERRTCLRCTLQHRRPPQLWRYGPLLPRAVAHLDLLLAPSEFTAERHRRAFPDAPIEVLRHPPPSLDDPDALGAPTAPERPYLLFAGRLEPIKGAVWLFDALHEDVGVDLVFAGDGSQLGELQARAAATTHVRVLGKVARTEVLRQARDALALVIPSIGYESAGAVGLEAMSLGTPVLARDLGALPELVQQGGGALFRDEEELRATIRRLLADRAWRDDLAASAKEAADPVTQDVRFFRRYFELLSRAAERSGRTALAGTIGVARDQETF